jgi:hypothetical protein
MLDSYLRQRNSGLVEVATRRLWLLLLEHYHKLGSYMLKWKSGKLIRNYLLEHL